MKILPAIEINGVLHVTASDCAKRLREIKTAMIVGDRKHSPECAADESGFSVCEGTYVEKVDQVLDLIEALEGIATANAGYSAEAKATRRMALSAIALQETDLDAAGCAREELKKMGPA